MIEPTTPTGNSSKHPNEPGTGVAFVAAGLVLALTLTWLIAACGDADIVIPGSGVPTVPTNVPTGSASTPTPES